MRNNLIFLLRKTSLLLLLLFLSGCATYEKSEPHLLPCNDVTILANSDIQIQTVIEDFQVSKGDEKCHPIVIGYKEEFESKVASTIIVHAFSKHFGWLGVSCKIGACLLFDDSFAPLIVRDIDVRESISVINEQHAINKILLGGCFPGEKKIPGSLKNYYNPFYTEYLQIRMVQKKTDEVMIDCAFFDFEEGLIKQLLTQYCLSRADEFLSSLD